VAPSIRKKLAITSPTSGGRLVELRPWNFFFYCVSFHELESKEDARLASRYINGFVAFKCFMVRESTKIYQVLLAGESL
jgi:hypothetical protein